MSTLRSLRSRLLSMLSLAVLMALVSSIGISQSAEASPAHAAAQTPAISVEHDFIRPGDDDLQAFRLDLYDWSPRNDWRSISPFDFAPERSTRIWIA